MTKNWEKEFDKKFVSTVKDVNGNIAYQEWQAYDEEELIASIKSFIQQLQKSKGRYIPLFDRRAKVKAHNCMGHAFCEICGLKI